MLQTIPLVVPFAETAGDGLKNPALSLEVDVGLEESTPFAYENALRLSFVPQI
jgi:hypothetical protein